MEKRRFKALINGKTYTIVGTKSPEHLQSVTHLVNEQLQQIKTLLPQGSIVDHAILLAVNTVSTQLEQQMTIERLQEQLRVLRAQVTATPTGEQLSLDALLQTEADIPEKNVIQQSSREQLRRKKHNPAFKKKR